MSMAYEAYMKQVVKPMREELVQAGFKELLDAEQVEQFMDQANGTVLVMVNSVCGCAAGLARPSARLAVEQSGQKPDHLITVFAGQEREATAKMREYFSDCEPSSPSIALLKDGKLVHFIPREEIEDSEVDQITGRLVNALEEHCN